MKIDMNNYEAFFLDFAEGKLDNSSTLEMLAFLRNHPELKEELENFSDVRLSPSQETFKEKDFLKKLDFEGTGVNHKNFDDYCIAYYEKILTTPESEKLFSFLGKYPDKKTDFEKYGKVFLKADPSVVYEAKPFLKKKTKRAVRTIILKWTAVAAGIVLAVSVFYRSAVEDEKTSGYRLPTTAKITAPAGSPESISPVIKKTVVIDRKNIAYKKPPQQIVTDKEETILAEQEPVREENLALLNPIDPSGVDGVGYSRPEIAPSLKPVTNPAFDDSENELFAYAGKMIKEKVLKGEDRPKKKFSFWDIADITIKGYNSISEKDIILHRETDENGKLTAIAIETENRKYGFETKN